METGDDPRAADVFDFVDEYLGDVEAGREHALEFYLARYPRCTDAIAREYAALRAPASTGSDREHAHASSTSFGREHAHASSTGSGREHAHASSTSAGRAHANGDERRVGPYRLVRELGRGGQGAVFLAEDTRIARHVALKMLAAHLGGVSHERLKRFRREADVIARLEHPHICGIYDADLDGDTPWIAMRHVDGETLAEILERARRVARESPSSMPSGPSGPSRPSGQSGPSGPSGPSGSASGDPSSDVTTAWPPATWLDLHRVLLLFERCARALHAAHEAGVIHRDVKPGNIMVARDGKPVLLDFGLARDEQSDVGHLTQSGDVFGTPAYMSPEQLSNRSDELDRRTDVYSLGVSLYEALTLARPFDAPQRVALFHAIQTKPPPDPRKANAILSEDVKVVIETALEKDRDRRYATALELAEDLRRIREYEPVHARPASVGLRFARWTQRHPALAVSIIGTIVALSAGLAVSLTLLSREKAALARESTALSERTAALTDRTQALSERTAALTDRTQALSERTAALNEKTQALFERTAALTRETEAVEEQQIALRWALGRHLAERATALIVEDPSASLALAIDAVKRAPNYLTRSALFTALDECYLECLLDAKPARAITDLALAGDDAHVVAVLDDGTTRMFDLLDGSRVADFGSPTGDAGLVRCSPDGHWIASASASGTLVVRDAVSNDVVCNRSLQQPIVAMEIDAAASRLLVLSGTGAASIWNARTWQLEVELDQGPGGIVRAVLSRDGTRVLTIAAAGHAAARVATVWNAHDGRRLLDVKGHRDAILACDVSSSGGALLGLTASRDKSVRVFDLDTGASVGVPLVHDAPVVLSRFSPNGSQIVSATDAGDEAGTVHLWRLSTARDTPLSGHAGHKVVDAAFSPDGSRVATAGGDLSVRLWSANDGSEQRQFRANFQPQSVLWTRDGRHVVSRANALCAHVWCATNHPDVFSWRAHDGRVTSAAFSADGALALTASDDGTARVWCVRPDAFRASCARTRDRELDSVATETRTPGELVLVLRHAARISGAWFGPDGDAVLTASDDRTACVWSARSGRALCEPFVHPCAVRTGAFSADGSLVLTTCADGIARVWSRERLDPVLLRASGSVRITCATFDPAGALVAAGADDDILRVFDATTGELRSTSPIHSNASIGIGISAVAFHPCGDEIAAACGDNAVRFFDARTSLASRPVLSLFPPRSLCFDADGERMLVIGRWGGGGLRVQDLSSNRPVQYPGFHHTNDIACGSFSIDGRYALTASKDATAYVWDARSYQPVTHRTGHTAPITCAAFSADRDEPRVITGCEDGSVSVWPVDPLPAAEKRKPRDLDPWERAREERLASPLKYE